MAAAAASHLQHLAAIAILSVIITVVGSAPAAAMEAGAPGPAPEAPPAARLRHRAFLATLDDATGSQDGGSGSGGMMECWSALTQLGSCTNEMLLFFFNGESYIGPECCRAIRGATRHCWPSTLASFGFTADQVDVLSGFCEGEAKGQQGGAGNNNAPPAAGTSDAPPPGTKQ